ncbi:hypothetical protein [Paenibacillus sp.]|uniref:hypothetical protein n=1 Tax=Paenibacillus sp. TaxID=58172 RepID=UPI00281157A4|nr:hypothetical protein [Paenibacillus sp.]
MLRKRLTQRISQTSRSIVANATLTMFLIIVFLCATFVTVSYLREKRQYVSELEAIHVTANALLRTDIPLIETMIHGSEAEKQEATAKLQTHFDGFTQNKAIELAFRTRSS